MTSDEHRAKCKATALAGLWIMCAMLTSGFINANFRAEFPELLQSPRWAAIHRNQAIVFSVMTGPVGLVIAALTTGAFYDGWTLSGEAAPCTTAHPNLWCKACATDSNNALPEKKP
jgi:hypothetical protein